MQHFVAFTGKHGSGKRTLSRYVAQELGFVRHSADDIYKNTFCKVPSQSTEDERRLANDILRASAYIALSRGFDVALDVHANNDASRARVFDIAGYGLSREVKKTLVCIQITPETQERRNEERKSEGYGNGYREFVSRFNAGWEEPKESKHYELIVCDNDSTDDLERAKNILKTKFTGRILA
jgi:predicted kinase